MLLELALKNKFQDLPQFFIEYKINYVESKKLIILNTDLGGTCQ